MAVTRDGRALALGGRRVEILDAASRETRLTVELRALTLAEASPMLRGSPEADRAVPVRVVALAFAPDGRTLAAGCRDGTVRLVDLAP